MQVQEYKTFIANCYDELGREPNEAHQRMAYIESGVLRDGTYEHTYEELEHGARMAWRNSNRCIGRLFWKSLHVVDERRLQTEEEVASALYQHIAYATNEGKIRPTITVFHPSVRIWNHQLIRYAGYETDEGIVGDPQSIQFTQVCEQLGWKGARTNFDVLPLVVQVGMGAPKWFTVPQEIILEVPIRHPDLPQVEQLGLKWYAVPMISDMALEIGGIWYPAAPFNGWYMETEIGARNFADVERYNILPKLAQSIGLDTSSESSLWKDKALVELNVAVLHSFQERGVTMVNHHTAAKQFAYFEQIEADLGREITGDWTWLIPPLSPATTHVFHSHYDDIVVTPNYFRQDAPYITIPQHV